MGNYYPKIKLKKNISMDVQNGIGFLNYQEVKNKKFLVKKFFPENLHYVLSNNFSKKEKEKIIEEYTKLIYKNKKKEIDKGLKDAKENWREVEERYFRLIDGIFKKHPWPKGSYRGFISIWGVFPRHIEQKIFFFPYKHQIPEFTNKVIAHEMLHFIFFDYLQKKYNVDENTTIKGRAKDYLWKISEIFNSVIESWEPYSKLFKGKAKPYFNDGGIFKKMQSDWEKEREIDEIINKWIIRSKR